MKTGVELIAEERTRQIEEEGWTPEHDDDHRDDEIAWAAVCYAAPDRVFVTGVHGSESTVVFNDPWPWDIDWDKREDLDDPPGRIRQLQMAGALIAAEIDRLQRKEEREQKAQPFSMER